MTNIQYYNEKQFNLVIGILVSYNISPQHLDKDSSFAVKEGGRMEVRGMKGGEGREVEGRGRQGCGNYEAKPEIYFNQKIKLQSHILSQSARKSPFLIKQKMMHRKLREMIHNPFTNAILNRELRQSNNIFIHIQIISSYTSHLG